MPCGPQLANQRFTNQGWSAQRLQNRWGSKEGTLGRAAKRHPAFEAEESSRPVRDNRLDPGFESLAVPRLRLQELPPVLEVDPLQTPAVRMISLLMAWTLLTLTPEMTSLPLYDMTPSSTKTEIGSKLAISSSYSQSCSSECFASGTTCLRSIVWRQCKTSYMTKLEHAEKQHTGWTRDSNQCLLPDGSYDWLQRRVLVACWSLQRWKKIQDIGKLNLLPILPNWCWRHYCPESLLHKDGRM
jgi:hypothetical protein